MNNNKEIKNEFEKEFDKLLEKPEYDSAEEALFKLTRAAFDAGWRAGTGAETA